MKRIHLVVATRPNFMKAAPVCRALLERGGYDVRVIHTGQHYDHRMSALFLQQLGMSEPHRNLGVGSGSHAVQTAAVLTAYEPLLEAERPDLVIVPGDVNSTLACALAAAKLHIPVAHLEAGLRSFDMTMPEEVNRRLTDALSGVLWTPSADADENLLREGVAPERISLVGNCMIDSLHALMPSFEADQAPERYGLPRRGYALVTLHRPQNVDDPDKLRRVLETLARLSESMPVAFPVHPRTAKMIRRFELETVFASPNFLPLEPLGYVEFMSLVGGSGLVVTDSGGLQEETSALGIPCLTVRPNTERPITCTLGTNRLVEQEGLDEAIGAALAPPARIASPIPLWDGSAARRITDDLERRFADGALHVKP